MDDPLQFLGMKVVRSYHVRWDQMLVAGPTGTVMVHGLLPLLSDELAARMTAETPAEGAARIVGEVLRWHAQGPDQAVAAAARAEMDHRGMT